MSDKIIFDTFRDILGRGFTPAEVERINAALRQARGEEDAPPATGNVVADPALIAQLKIDEGLRLKAYQDTVGVWTIGYGHTGPEVKPGLTWTQAQAEAALVEDVLEHNAKLAAALPWLNLLDPVRRRVLQNMAFNLGIGDAQKGTGLLGFKNTLNFSRTGHYDEAASNMRKSKWAGQVGQRAVRLSNQMRNGV